MNYIIPKPKDVKLEAGQVITLEEMKKWNEDIPKCALCGRPNDNHFHNVEEFDQAKVMIKE